MQVEILPFCLLAKRFMLKYNVRWKFSLFCTKPLKEKGQRKLKYTGKKHLNISVFHKFMANSLTVMSAEAAKDNLFHE